MPAVRMLVKQIFLVSTLQNVENTVWRLCILMFACEGLTDLNEVFYKNLAENFWLPLAFSVFETIPVSLIRNVFWVKWNCFTFLKKHLSFFIRVKESFSGNSVKISGCQHLVNLSLYLAARHLVTVLFYTSAFFLNTKQKLLLSVQLNWSPE